MSQVELGRSQNEGLFNYSKLLNRGREFVLRGCYVMGGALPFIAASSAAAYSSACRAWIASTSGRMRMNASTSTGSNALPLLARKYSTACACVQASL